VWQEATGGSNAQGCGRPLSWPGIPPSIFSFARHGLMFGYIQSVLQKNQPPEEIPAAETL
jgi:hypothetical protein